ncbi:unnamed protein product [Didymodactylos carnosus]|uniref:Uncharacterized protein n=1 Tax=Didymodactylos carnosus TaxID=1234261 RepID=A0A814GVA5_9BILA|nr:unnamed protein product [Didymodactylos carnosus]CAF1413532.1 unnamed protein product [Didymodactylos carnosus]CAF3772629.1 unnamed protein product [Didymodactylos carnosus]CAF4216720.1 unnamed protein product [Didymodactylos carnosus]
MVITETTPGLNTTLLTSSTTISTACTFGASQNYASGTSLLDLGTPVFTISSDFNGDSYSDIAVANVAGSFAILLNDQTGGFPSYGMKYSTGSTLVSKPNSLTAEDFDKDGDMDIAIADLLSQKVSLFKNGGSGTFTAYPTSPAYTTAIGTTSIVAALLNSDSYPDLAVINPVGVAFTTGTVGVFINKADGTGAFNQQVEYQVGTLPYAVIAADINNDQKLDLIVTNVNVLTGSIGVLLGDGTGAFGIQTQYSVGSIPHYVTANDFNGDGYLDLAAANTGGSGSITVLLNKGDGTFTSGVDYPILAAPQQVISGDFNADGYVDLAVISTAPISIPPTTQVVGILAGNGDGTFQGQVTSVIGITPGSISLTKADFNKDGKVDVATTAADPLAPGVDVMLGQC